MKIFVLILATALATTGTTVMAESPQKQSVSVSAEGLDLSSSHGRELLDNRLKSAINKVCGVHKSPGLPAWIRFRKCVEAKQLEVKPARDALIAQAKASAGLAAR